MRSFNKVVLALSATATLSSAAFAGSASGTFGDVRWKAQSNIVGVTSTGTNGPGGFGDPIYLASAAKYRGTVGLFMDYGAAGGFVCSGSLSANRAAIITAAHCVSDGGLGRPNSVTAFFYDGSTTNGNIYNPATTGVTQVAIGSIHVNPMYSGQVIDQNDIAVLRLAGAAPTFANGYEILTAGDLSGLDFNVAGYGLRSNAGGNVGITPGTSNVGRLRQGDNRFDFAFGDADFGGFFTNLNGDGQSFFDNPLTNNRHGDATFSFVADFDNGLTANDGSCRLATEGFGISASGKYCNLGLGAREVTTAGGDSGGPQFINGKLASVTSYGLSFGSAFGDLDDNLNDTFGEYAGYVPTYIHAEWIAGVVPEPASWALMIAGFGLVGGAARRARVNKVKFANA